MYGVRACVRAHMYGVRAGVRVTLSELLGRSQNGATKRTLPGWWLLTALPRRLTVPLGAIRPPLSSNRK